jgi:hypothetical protein
MKTILTTAVVLIAAATLYLAVHQHNQDTARAKAAACVTAWERSRTGAQTTESARAVCSVQDWMDAEVTLKAAR